MPRRRIPPEPVDPLRGLMAQMLGLSPAQLTVVAALVGALQDQTRATRPAEATPPPLLTDAQIAEQTMANRAAFAKRRSKLGLPDPEPPAGQSATAPVKSARAKPAAPGWTGPVPPPPPETVGE